MDPAVVGSNQFGQVFKAALPGVYVNQPEQIFSQPLVFTPANGTTQYVYWATTQNNVYKMNAKTGEIVASRNLHIPFLTADLSGCVDINPTVGITATGVIDPDTETLYLTSKTYVNQNGGQTAQGRDAGRYYVHALSTADLSERPNFPLLLDGIYARNNPTRMFTGGIHHQRPGLLHTGNFIYAGFASHCVQYNFTGWVIGWDKTTGTIVEHFATEGQPFGPDIKGGGVWMSGGGMSSDDLGSIFMGTGNGYASQLADIPVKGYNPPTSLEEAAVHMSQNADGSINVVDFFMPWEKRALDGADKDLGTTPLEMLPSQFQCGDIKRVGVITGKSGKTYWLNLDNLGGYKNGDGGYDKVIQMYQNDNSVYAGAGVYPLEGGYIYINVIQYPTNVFKFSCTNGQPSFSLVATSPEKNAYILGTGHGTTTSLNGQPGTGLFWVTDVQGLNLRIYDAVPKGDKLNLINSFNIDGVTKFTRPVFGDGIVYIGTTKGYVYAFGSPVNSPMNCTSPVDFGNANLTVSGNQTSATTNRTITCTANIGLSVTGIEVNDNTDFSISNVPTVPLNLNAGDSVTLQGTFHPASVGLISADVIFNTTNSVAGYSTQAHARLTGTGQSPGPLLAVNPNTLTFDGAVTGVDAEGVSKSFRIQNGGNSLLTMKQVQFSTSSNGPFQTWDPSMGDLKVGQFTLQNISQTIGPNVVDPVTVIFNTSTSGSFGATVKFISDGGTQSISIAGNAGPPPKAVLEFQTPDQTGWVSYVPGVPFTFGNVTENKALSLKFRVTNGAPSGGVSLTLSVSKPPFGVDGIVKAANQVDLAEGTKLAPGESATATLTCGVPKSQWNVDSYNGTAQWTMNNNDPNFGKQYIQFFCEAVAEQAPPLQTNGSGQSQYRYIGCYKENNPGRQLDQLLYGNDNSTIAMCVSACDAGSYAFCGAQYQRECWGGNTIPTLKVDDSNCNYFCAGDVNQICGGNGVGAGAGGAYISLFQNPNVTSKPRPGAPSVNPGVDGYTSIGCYTEATNGRALPNGVQTAKKTVQQCVDACKASKYTYAGLEYGGECWCGNAFTAGSVPTAIGDCNMPCNDNATEYCGAGSRLNVYQYAVVSSSVAPSSTSTVSSSTSSISTSSSTISTSTSTPLNSTSTVSSSTTPSSSTSTVSSGPTGNSTVSSSTVPSTTTVSSAVSSTTTSSSSATPTQTGPVVKDIVSGTWKSQGCWTEPQNRALPDKMYADDNMTLESCAKFCGDNGFPLFGAEYTRECWCGKALDPASQLAADQTNCNMLCGGDKLEYCGGPGRLNVYKAITASSSSSSTPVAPSTPPTSGGGTVGGTTTNSIPAGSGNPVGTATQKPTASSSAQPTPTGPAKKDVVGTNWQFQGCQTEGNGQRTLNQRTFANDSMTLEACAKFCDGLTYFGVEYGRECYCGNSLVGGSTLAANQADCNFLCPGDKTEYCGAGNRLELYKWVASGATSTVPTSAVSSSAAPTSAAPTSAAPSSDAIPPGSGDPAGTLKPASSSSVASSTPSSASSAAPSSPSAAQSTSPASSTLASSAPSSTAASSTPSSASSSVASSTTTSSAKPTPTGPVVSEGNANYTYYNCVSEPSQGRLLATQIANNNKNMTIEYCLQKCSGYGWAGVEYGQECWCGNQLRLNGGQSATTPGKNVSASDCKFTCPGNSTEFCGAGVRMNVYVLKAMVQDGVDSATLPPYQPKQSRSMFSLLHF